MNLHPAEIATQIAPDAHAAVGRFFDWLVAVYDRGLVVALRYRRITLTIMQAAQDITVGARLSKTQYQYSLVDVDSDELNHWAPMLLQKMQALSQLADVASDQQSAGPTLKVEINRDVASRMRVDPALVRLFSTTPLVSATWRGFTRL